MGNHVVQFTGDAVAFLGPGPLGEAGLGGPQLLNEHELVADERCYQHNDDDRGGPGCPADVPLCVHEPFAHKQQHRPGPVDQAHPRPREQDTPRAEHQYGEPDNVERLAVAEHDYAYGGHRRIGEREPWAGEEQGSPGQETHQRPRGRQGRVA